MNTLKETTRLVAKLNRTLLGELGVFARIRSFAYNILRFNQSDTIPQDRYAAALGGLKSIFSMTFSK